MVLIFVTAAPGAGPIGACIVCEALRAPNHTLTTATDLTSLLTSARTLGAIIPDRGPLESMTPSAGRK